MLALFLALMAAAWLIDAADSDTVHAAVVFVRTGERTPAILANGTKQTLTPLGAQQIYQLGQQFRGRYINGLEGHVGLGQSQIGTLSPFVLDHNEVFVMTTQEPYLVASAQAFMQGFYPPFSINGTTVAPLADASGILSNGTVVQYPLNGYQYPEIRVASDYDPYSIYLAGHEDCPRAEKASFDYYTTPEAGQSYMSAGPVYESLDRSLFEGFLDPQLINYIQASAIYEYISYRYTHDSSVRQYFNDSTEDEIYNDLRYYADEDQWYRWGNASSSSSGSDLQTMAGKTLSAMILGQFQNLISQQYNTSKGPQGYPVSFLFGDHEPMISLMSLFRLADHNDHFKSIPPYGSAIIFELFSPSSTAFPSDPSNLWVRFRYQNGTTFNGDPQSYPIFGRTPSQSDMPWLDFQDSMSNLMVNTISDWCRDCGSGAFFCAAVDDDTTIIIDPGDGYGRRNKLSNAVAGVIGAVVTLAIAALVFALLMLVGGVRFHRVHRGSNKKSDLGGFKGSAKLASDADLHLPKGAALHAGIVSFGAKDGSDGKPKERVGSWELKQKEAADNTGNDFGVGEERGRDSIEEIEASMHRPVLPHERV